MPKWIIGIGAYSHDASVSVLCDGEIVFSAQEERFDRRKHSSAFPRLALVKAISHLGISATDISNYAYFYSPIRDIFGNATHIINYFPSSLNLLRAGAAEEGDSYLGKLKRHFQVAQTIKSTLGLKFTPKVDFIQHHQTHAASAFYASPYSEAAILTMDGRGEDTTTAFYFGSNTKINQIHKIKVPHSMGHFYAAITDYLGFRSFFDEWKVMGLSAYGTNELVDSFKDLAQCNEGNLRLNLEYFKFHTHGFGTWLSPKFYNRFGPKREPNSELTQKHFDIAYAAQKLIESMALELTKEIYKHTNTKNLCIAGGVAFNVLMNKKIITDGPFENVYIQPLAGDSGASAGAALQSYYSQGYARNKRAFVSLYLGPNTTENEILAAHKKYNLVPTKPKNLILDTANALANGKIVAWYQGRMEAGPRALGNRSILAHPGLITMKDKLNLKTKRREAFRPFAPSVTNEKYSKYFELPNNIDSPYMVIAGNVKNEYKETLRAVTHVDGSARVHTVTKEVNPCFHLLLEEFEKITGFPILLNTSFNESEPIVDTPAQAIACYLRTEIDILVMDEYWLEK
jgi:carbamoyltransferase